MGVFANIRNALNTRLSTLASVPTVQWPNTTSIPSLANVYMRPTLLPIRSTQVQLSGMYRHAGIYQVDVFAKTGVGTKVIDGWCDALLAHYHLQVLVSGGTNVHIQTISVGSISREEAWIKGFIEIAYECYA